MNSAISPVWGADRVHVSEKAVTSETSTGRGGIALTLHAITKRFGGVQAIADVDMQVGQGEIHAVIGPNGAGKSTLLNLISGLYPADSGTISVGGAKRPKARDLSRLGVARTFQNLALFRGLGVAQNVAMGRRIHARAGVLEQIFGLPRARRDRRDVRHRVDDMLAFLELDAVRDRRLDGLPYGVLKRIELARAIVAEPRLLLLDEPMAGMNGTDKPEMAGLHPCDARQVRHHHRADRARHRTSSWASSDRITVLDYGRKIAEGTPDEIRRNDPP